MRRRQTGWFAVAARGGVAAAEGYKSRASDIPFATPTQQAVESLRLALQVGLTDRQIQGITGGQARRVLAHQDLLDLGPTPPTEQPIGPALERMYVMLVAACERMLGGQDSGQELLMALDGCAAGADGPGTNGLRRVGRCAKRTPARPLPRRPRADGRTRDSGRRPRRCRRSRTRCGPPRFRPR